MYRVAIPVEIKFIRKVSDKRALKCVSVLFD